MPARKPTHRETEIKLHVADVPALIGRLRQLGARYRGRVLERNTLFDTPESDLRRRGRLLRLRVEVPAPFASAKPGRRSLPLRGVHRVVLTSKAPVSVPPTRTKPPAQSRYKEKAEREVILRDGRHWPRILRSLGLRPVSRYEKYRAAFRLPGLHLDLDETPVGAFLEMEGSPQGIDRAARLLGFSSGDYIRGTYGDLYAADCRRRGRVPRNMIFGA